eukprot:COSAG01_NODE_43960_length_424_cov_0.916923_1_plen_63_part_01
MEAFSSNTGGGGGSSSAGHGNGRSEMPAVVGAIASDGADNRPGNLNVPHEQPVEGEKQPRDAA